MKKSLFAIAAVTAFAGAAQAQSSVTVYGIIDAGFASTSSRLGNAKATNAGFSGGSGNGSETSSRIGFRGTEDLGGGTSAFFTIETELNWNANGVTPSATASSAATGVINGNRQTFVGLAKKGIGRAAIGTQYTVTHDAVAATDPGQSNNVVGSIIRPAGGAATTNSVAFNNGSGANHMVRTTNMIKFNSDKFAGVGINAAYIQNNADSTQSVTGTALAAGTGGSANFYGYNLGADYTWQKLFVTATYGTVKQEQNATLGTTLQTLSATPASNALVTPATITAGTNPNTTTTNMYVGGMYNFGVLTAYAAYTSAKIEDNYNSNQFVKRSGQQLGARSFITPKIEGWASIGNGRLTTYGVNQPTANFNAWQLGSNYLLSKRTNLYAIYGQMITSSSATVAGGAAASQYAMGVRHTF
jgi:predicted porin